MAQFGGKLRLEVADKEAWLDFAAGSIVLAVVDPPPFNAVAAVRAGYDWFTQRPQFTPAVNIVVTGTISRPPTGTQDYLFLTQAT